MLCFLLFVSIMFSVVIWAAMVIGKRVDRP